MSDSDADGDAERRPKIEGARWPGRAGKGIGAGTMSATFTSSSVGTVGDDGNTSIAAAAPPVSKQAVGDGAPPEVEFAARAARPGAGGAACGAAAGVAFGAVAAGAAGTGCPGSTGAPARAAVGQIS